MTKLNNIATNNMQAYRHTVLFETVTVASELNLLNFQFLLPLQHDNKFWKYWCWHWTERFVVFDFKYASKEQEEKHRVWTSVVKQCRLQPFLLRCKQVGILLRTRLRPRNIKRVDPQLYRYTATATATPTTQIEATPKSKSSQS